MSQGDVADQIVHCAVLEPLVNTPDALLGLIRHLLVQTQTFIEKLFRGCCVRQAGLCPVPHALKVIVFTMLLVPVIAQVQHL